ncbi:MAG: D-aminoacylase [bacterium]|nr:D-aminoacylase [bacterium]
MTVVDGSERIAAVKTDRFLAWPLVAFLVVLWLLACADGPPPASILIADVVLVDGTGADRRPASVRILGDRIVEVGELEPIRGEAVVDGGGLALAPGFIDTHSHHDDGLFEAPDALAAVSQGITTIVAGQDGGSRLPLADYFARLEESPAAVHVASYSGHNTLREQVMGEDFRRAATDDEVEEMRELVRRDLEAGALGLATGLEYDPGIYSETDEVLALAREAAAAGGRYISHIRSEDRTFFSAVEEILLIGREARIPVQISHMKLAMVGLWGRSGELLERLDEARAEGVDVTADVYPYTYWQSTLTVLFPERDFDNRRTADFVLAQLAPADGLLLGQFDPEPSYIGRTVAEVAEIRGVEPAEALMQLIAESQALQEKTGKPAESVIATSMEEEDVTGLLAWPHANVSTDGELDGRHPRGFGAFPRVLGRMVREQGLLTLEEAVRKMTSLAAEHVGIEDRGVVRPGAVADLVLLDPDRVLDRATPEDPQAVSVGIERVWVAGREVYAHGKTTGERPGRVIRRSDS